MIAFKYYNIEGEKKYQEYDDIKALETEWWSDECNCPANDDEMIEIFINDKDKTMEIRNYVFEKITTDTIWFEDLLNYLGVKGAELCNKGR